MGPGGVGKSFLANEISKQIKTATFRSASFSNLFIVLIKSIPVLFFLLFLKKDRFKVLKIFVLSSSKWRFIRKSLEPGIYLIDEGPWHFLCSSIAPRIPKWSKKFILIFWRYYLKLPSIVINLKADPCIIQKRRLTRCKKNEKTTNLEKIKESLLMFEFFLEKISGRYENILCLTYDISLKQISDEIIKDIRKLCNIGKDFKRNYLG